MRTQQISGYFDVKVYRKGVAHEDRQTKGETDAITFATTYPAADVPADLAPYGKPYTSQKDGTQRVRVTWKINHICTWWQMQNGKATQTAKPVNAELDGKRYLLTIDYKVLNGDPSKLEPCGLWANAILWEEAQTADPFGDLNAADPAAVPEPAAVPAPAAAPLTANTIEDPNRPPF